MKSRSMDLTEGPVVSGIIRYTIPIVLSSALQLLFNAADLMVVGQFCGSISVGAISSTGAITNLLVNLFVGLSVGAGVCVAHAMGSHKEEELHHTVHTAIPLSILCGLLLTVVGVVLTRPLLIMMDTPPDVLPLSATYMIIYFGGITFTILYNFGSAILRAAGDTRSSLIYLSAAGVLNIILNLVFVIFFHMNVAGVGLATVISQALSAVLVLRELMHRPDACRFNWKESHIYSGPLRKMTTIGLPAGVQGCLFSISNVVIQSSVNSFGSVMVAGCGAASNIEGFIWTTMNGVSQSAVNYIGQNLGARKFNRIHKIFCLSLCPPAAEHLHYRFPCRHCCRPGANVLDQSSLFCLRHYGYPYRLSPGAGKIPASHAGKYSGGLRPSDPVGVHYFQGSPVPYSLCSFCLLYRVLAGNGNRPVYSFQIFP